MIEYQLKDRGITSRRVLKAMESVPRHLFVEEDLRREAYFDGPLPIGHGQTISQPYIVAFMTEALNITRRHRVLEIGTGSGYQSAVLSTMAKEVISVEFIQELANSAHVRLSQLGYNNVQVFHSDGKNGWADSAPYHRILATASRNSVPFPLVDQLSDNGKMIIPIGRDLFGQHLEIISKDMSGRVKKESSLPVRFVPMV